MPCDHGDERQAFTKGSPNHALYNFNGNCIGIAVDVTPGVPAADAPVTIGVDVSFVGSMMFYPVLRGHNCNSRGFARTSDGHDHRQGATF